MFDDDDPCAGYRSKLFNQPPKQWECATIQVFPEGKWLTFKDGKTKRTLNSPRQLNAELHIPYRYRGYRPPEPAPAVSPLDIPVSDNYTAFRARRKIYGHRGAQSARSVGMVSLCYPGDQSTKRFKGDKLGRNPFRVSATIANERRLQEARPVEPQRPRVNTARRIPTLFKRSITRKKKESVWPPDECFVQDPTS